MARTKQVASQKLERSAAKPAKKRRAAPLEYTRAAQSRHRPYVSYDRARVRARATEDPDKPKRRPRQGTLAKRRKHYYAEGAGASGIMVRKARAVRDTRANAATLLAALQTLCGAACVREPERKRLQTEGYAQAKTLILDAVANHVMANACARSGELTIPLDDMLAAIGAPKK